MAYRKQLDRILNIINKLPNPSNDEHAATNLHLGIKDILRRIIVSYCIAELDVNNYNDLIVDLEKGIRDLREKDKAFKAKFNKRDLAREIIEDYNDASYIIIEPEVSFFLKHSHNREIDESIKMCLINFFKDRLKIINDINARENSLFIVNPN